MFKRHSFEELQQEKKRPLVLDGAVGSYLQTELKLDPTPLWTSELNITHPYEVIALHKKYIEAGADIITTNTFRTNPAAIEEGISNNSKREFVEKAVELAIDAKGEKKVLISGSNAPAEDCYQVERTISQSELVDNHHSHIEDLWNSGVDFILNETMSHFDEIEITAKFYAENNIPFVQSLFLYDNLRILSGDQLPDVINFINNYSPLAIGINCVSPSLFSKIDLSIFENVNFGFYLNCGSGKLTDEKISCGVSPTDYVDKIRKYKIYNPVFIGSCCGSNPSHTKAIRNFIDEVYSN